MGDKEKESLEDIVARSNLMATAGEFIPKSKTRKENGKDQECDISHLSPIVNEVSVNIQDEATSSQCIPTFLNNNDNNAIYFNHSQTGKDFCFDSKEEELIYFPEEPHSSSWRRQAEPDDFHYPENDGSMEKPTSDWGNKDSRYLKYSNNRKWNKADKKYFAHNSEPGQNEEYLSRSSDFHPRNDDSRSKAKNEAVQHSKFKQRQSGYDRHPTSVKSYVRNGTTFYGNQGWASVPQSGSSTGDGLPIREYREYQPRNFGLRPNNGELGEGEDSSTRKKVHNAYHGAGNACRNNDDHLRKDNFWRSGMSFKNRDDGNNDKDKNSKTNQRERLIDLLTRGVLECLVCCEQVHQNAPIWSCSNCFHVLHLKCIIKWAKSSKSDFGWRCPACQNMTKQVPSGYFCFCGAVRNPEWNRSDCPHSCGEVCGKTLKKSCPHKCTLLCHPGPCPQCTATVVKSCGCQRRQKTVQCCNSDVVTCGTVCGKELNCKVHQCMQNCHMDACAACSETVKQDCYCGKESRSVICTPDTAGIKKYSCGKICGLQLSCESHFCDSVCHEGECKKCDLLPEVVKFCHCGKTEISSLIEDARKTCKDTIPTCDLICGKDLICGQPGNRHTCQSKCHEGACPICPLETVVKCRCGHMDKMLPCSELLNRADDARCNKRCTKKRSCGKHKCNQNCCIDIDHICPLPCNRILQCSLHRCERTCHRGHCTPCWRVSFDELYCECGNAVIFPPVPCGTRRPLCLKPCSRTHNCDHVPTHNCHSSSQCPPCTVLTKKYCYGRHELRKAVPCHQDTFSCGLPCNKELHCGRHKCILACHEGLCLKEGQSCTQLCKVPRPVCGHQCGAPCHDGPCLLDFPCKEMVKVTCECGHRYSTRACHDNAKEYHRIATAQLATKMADLQAGQTIDLDDFVLKKLSYKTLECNDECRLIERNRRVAIALQIRNPDLSAKLTPRYSDFMKHWAKKDARFCQMVHDKLTDLVQLAKQSKQKSRSYSFDSMNREKRQFVHEYCEHFGCQSVAYDPEPKRNVVATALKDQSWLPSMSLLEVIQRESYPRKVPAPVNVKMTALPKSSQRTMEVLPLRLPKNQQTVNNESNSSDQSNSQIDYFDWQPAVS